MKDKRSINAVEVAERFGRGEVTKEELNASYAAAAAYAAYAAYDDAYAYAAYAAYAAYDDGYVYTAYTAYTAYAAAAYAADAAYDDAYAADADDACKANQLQTANICREIIGDIIIQIVNAKLSC